MTSAPLARKAAVEERIANIDSLLQLALTMRTLLMSALLLLCGCAFGDERDRPVGQNCDLATPPKSAGEEGHHGVLLLVFPRAREIGSDYHGCQVVWIQRKNEVTLAWIVVIKSGQAASVWSRDAEMQAMLGQCVGEKRTVRKGTPEVCGNSKNMIMKSYLPGCISKAPDRLTEAEFRAYDRRYCGQAE